MKIRPFPKFMVLKNNKNSPIFIVTKKGKMICIRAGTAFEFGDKAGVINFDNLIDLEGEAELQYVPENDDVFPRFEEGAVGNTFFFCSKTHNRELDSISDFFLIKERCAVNFKPFTGKFTIKNKDVDILSDKTFYRITAQKR